MKKAILFSLLALTCTACHTITLPTPSGPATVRSFGQKIKISELTYDPVTHTLKLKGYNNDQVAGMVALFEAGIEAGKKTVIP